MGRRSEIRDITYVHALRARRYSFRAIGGIIAKLQGRSVAFTPDGISRAYLAWCDANSIIPEPINPEDGRRRENKRIRDGAQT